MRAAVVRHVTKLGHCEDTRILRCHNNIYVCTPGSRHPNECGVLLSNDDLTSFSFEN